MNDYKEIILNHYEKYPFIQMEDFAKLFYQNSFGPLHRPSEEGVNGLINDIAKELLILDKNPVYNQMEYIGNDYYRVSLHMIKDGVISIEEMGRSFYESILSSPSMEDEDIAKFTKQIETLRYLIFEKIIHFDLHQFDQMVEDYKKHGIRPGHYRVIHKRYLKHLIGVDK